MSQLKNKKTLSLLILGAFTFLFVLSCSLLSIIQTEHTMMNGALTQTIHEHSEVPLSLPSQSLLASILLAVVFGVVSLNTLHKSLFSNLFTRWRIAFRDYHRRASRHVSCLFILLFQQGILHSKSF